MISDEPRRVADAIQQMGLRYAVITSVDRDDLDDGGAFIFAETIRRTREACPGIRLEVLIPDFQGSTGRSADRRRSPAGCFGPQRRDGARGCTPRRAQARGIAGPWIICGMPNRSESR